MKKKGTAARTLYRLLSLLIPPAVMMFALFMSGPAVHRQGLP